MEAGSALRDHESSRGFLDPSSSGDVAASEGGSSSDEALVEGSTFEVGLRQRLRRGDSTNNNAGTRTAESYRADLVRMTSRRHISLDASSQRSGHRRRRSSIAIVDASESELAGELDEGHSYMVVDFFRQVNKDAHRLRRMGSRGVDCCGGLICNTFARCLRKIGLGNPAVSVDEMRFDKADPLAPKAGQERSQRWTAGDGQANAASGEYNVDDDWEDEEDEMPDASEIQEQRKKVHDLGELPALDWTHVSRNLLFCIIVCGGLILTTLSEKLDDCLRVGELCLRQWCYAICIAIGSYFVVEMIAKMVASFFKWTLLLHTNNKAWIFIKLHKHVSLLVWSILLISTWAWFETTKWVFNEGGVVMNILGVFVTFTAVRVVSAICYVEMAHLYMWKPYVERARSSIWAQFVIFMMTDHAMGVPTKDAEGQALALGFTKARKLNEHISLYTVGKAIAFVHANALRHPLGPGRPGTDNEGVINSKTGARLFGGLLFDALMIKFNEVAIKDMVPEASAAHDDASGKGYPRPKSGEELLPRPLPFDSQLPMNIRIDSTVTDGMDTSSPYRRRLSRVPEDGETSDAETEKSAASDGAQGQGAASGQSHARNLPKEEEKEERGFPDGDNADRGVKRRQQHNRERPGSAEGGAGLRPHGHHRRSGGSSVPGGNKGIALAHLRHMTKSRALAVQVLDLFEVPPDGYISRKVFIERMVDVFVQRRSLQLTLGDYEAILKKVGYLLDGVSVVIVFFVALRIFGYNIGNLVLTWLSLAVAFSFLFGSSASAFFESIIFIFITKAYDVGDPVFFVDDTGIEDWYIVTRINMISTIFRRWDGQTTMVANSIMATKAIRNQWRSAPLLHHTMIAVAVDTPTEKLDQMKTGVANGMKRGRHRHKSGEGGLLPDTVDYLVKGLTEGNRLAIFIMCKQRENGSNMGRRFANDSLFIKLIAGECNRLGITYSMPPQPITFGRGAHQVLQTREEFLGGEKRMSR